MTPTRLRAFAAVVRLGSVKAAAAELGVSEAAVSLHVAHLRKELADELFVRTGSGIAFTPGGLRLARRATELLGLQEQTIREVGHAGRGRRLMHVAASALFAEHAAPGLIALFTSRAKDLEVELSVREPREFASLLANREVDVAIGPRPSGLPGTVTCTPFFSYQLVVVASPAHQAAVGAARPAGWLLGPSANSAGSAVAGLLRRLDVPETEQRIFQSTAAALEEARRGHGVTPVPSFVVADDLAAGRLVRVPLPAAPGDGRWHVMTLPEPVGLAAAAELARFVTTPRATQAMIHGAGVTIGHFRPSVHVTLWR
ncbi:LysR family transcriptional regulator [Jannaschia sp. R86511]|uniref:LysR family transcriptional regulator n=1 Tax=Jannaschia sp. R86511 TaxID=3093853 RepID=UPI0036D4303E